MGSRELASTSATPTRPAHAVAAPPSAEQRRSRTPDPLSSSATPERATDAAIAAHEDSTLISFVLNGEDVSVNDGISLLDVLREEFGCRSVKDGCSPQGQCGCCTIWVDGAPRVSCVTPVRRIAGRAVTTMEGVPAPLRERWARAFVARGASQCGFCTPGIVLRLAALEHESGRRPARTPTRAVVESALR